MFWLTIQYGILVLVNAALAYKSFSTAKELHKEKDSATLGAAVSGIANVLCALAVLAIYFHAMYYGQ